MHPSRVRGVPFRPILSVVLVLAGCSAAPAPSSAPHVVTGSPSLAPSPTVAPSASSAPSATPAPEPSAPAGGEPSASPEPSAEPEPSIDESGSATGGPDGCGTGSAGFFAHRDEVPAAFHFGGATIEFTTAAIGLRNDTYQADDAIPGGIGLTADEIAVRVDPGTHILLRADGVSIVDLTARVVPWATVSFEGGLADVGEGTALAWRTRADGSASISAPTTPGDWAVEFFPRWQAACVQGDGVAYGRVKVNG